jgi:hypothetical protein
MKKNNMKANKNKRKFILADSKIQEAKRAAKKKKFDLKKIKKDFESALTLDPETAPVTDVEMSTPKPRNEMRKGERRLEIRALRKQGINPFMSQPDL